MPLLSNTRIQAKHYYRFTYLKSEHWQNLRIAKLAEVDAVCRKCKVRDLSNDVHHLIYRNLYDVQLFDLIVLCRECHSMVHGALEKYREFMADSGLEKSSWSDVKKLLFLLEGGFSGDGKPSYQEIRQRVKALRDA